MKFEEVEALSSLEGQQIWQNVKGEEAHSFLLRFRDKYDENIVKAVAEQLTYAKKLHQKQPLWAQKGAICEGSLLEQSTPTEVAHFRASLMSGKKLLDGTGGMGVDTMALSRNFKETIYCEMEKSRAAMFGYNKELFEADSITIENRNSMEFLEEYCGEPFDWIFLDPARRTEGKRFISLEECMPNVIEYGPLLRKKASNIGIKISPAFDLSRLVELIPDLNRVVVISFEGEVREIFVTIERGKEEKSIEAVVLASDGAIRSHLVKPWNVEKSLPLEPNITEKYLYEPDGAIIKAGLVNSVAEEFGLARFSLHGIFLVGAALSQNSYFPGRVLKVRKEVLWQRKQIKKYLKEEEIEAATVIRRDFPLAPEIIRKDFKLAESDKQFLIFTTNSLGKKVMIDASRELGE